MSGRFTLRSTPEKIAQEFGLDDVPDLSPRYNIAPTQKVPVVRCRDDKKELAFLRWGLVPSWADDLSIGNRMINARSETAAIKPSFKKAFRSRRCLVVADGFFEWLKVDGRKQPFYVRLKIDRPFGMAGLWERWENGEEPVESCTILTTDANELMKPIHARMPVIVPHDLYQVWLDPLCQDTEKLMKVLRPYSSEEMVAYPVSTMVNNPKNKLGKCVEAVQ